MNRTKRFIVLFATILGLATMSAFASSPSMAATALPAAPAAPVVPLDGAPPMPPWIYIQAFSKLSPCQATGRAYVNTEGYQDYTCRYIGSVYRLYLLPYILIGG